MNSTGTCWFVSWTPQMAHIGVRIGLPVSLSTTSAPAADRPATTASDDRSSRVVTAGRALPDDCPFSVVGEGALWGLPLLHAAANKTTTHPIHFISVRRSPRRDEFPTPRPATFTTRTECPLWRCYASTRNYSTRWLMTRQTAQNTDPDPNPSTRAPTKGAPASSPPIVPPIKAEGKPSSPVTFIRRELRGDPNHPGNGLVITYA